MGMNVALCTFFGAQRHVHDNPAGRLAGLAAAGPVTPGSDAPQDHREASLYPVERHNH
jgi:hypothetical protein